MTNFEKIKSMTVEELALFFVKLAPKNEFRIISQGWCSHCQKTTPGYNKNCPLDMEGCPYSKVEIIINWLNLQVECMFHQ